MEVNVAEQRTAEQIVAACVRYWEQTNVPRSAITEMGAELATHLNEAKAAGKPPRVVVGSDLAAFAEEWAAVQRGPANRAVGTAAWKTPPRHRAGPIEWGLLAAIVATVVLIGLFADKEQAVDVETWRWIWVVTALVLMVAEMLTAGFFMLPFGIGAGAAAVLAWLDVGLGLQWTAFIIVSALSLVGLQRFVRHEDEDQPLVGSNRYYNQQAMVLEDIDPATGSGRVRVATEEWRATARAGLIHAGTRVRVVDIDGTRLVVEEE
jgi:membrane protein implicated in regulation of membrane protease activity